MTTILTQLIDGITQSSTIFGITLILSLQCLSMLMVLWLIRKLGKMNFLLTTILEHLGLSQEETSWMTGIAIEPPKVTRFGLVTLSPLEAKDYWKRQADLVWDGKVTTETQTKMDSSAFIMNQFLDNRELNSHLSMLQGTSPKNTPSKKTKTFLPRKYSRSTK